jgi:molybdate transport system regulatory protein
VHGPFIDPGLDFLTTSSYFREMAKSIHPLLGKGAFSINGSLWMEKKGQRFFGPGPVELMELIEETGSINQAAKKMKMSYKKAWEIVNNLNTMTARPLVITAIGGEKGGGSAITGEAKQLIAYHRLLRERFRKFLEAETKRLK